MRVLGFKMKMSLASILDRFEQTAALALFVFLVARVWPHDLSINILAPALVLVSEGIIVFFLLIRRSSADISLRPRDWAAAVIGTAAPLLVMKTAEPSVLGAGIILMLVGMMTQLAAKLSLRRSFGIVPANRGVKTAGAYRFARHPMYLGYMISHVGFLLLAPTAWNFSVYLVCWVCLLLRIEFEERLLSEDPGYQAFKRKVRFRRVPGVY